MVATLLLYTHAHVYSWILFYNALWFDLSIIWSIVLVFYNELLGNLWFYIWVILLGKEKSSRRKCCYLWPLTVGGPGATRILVYMHRIVVFYICKSIKKNSSFVGACRQLNLTTNRIYLLCSLLCNWSFSPSNACKPQQEASDRIFPLITRNAFSRLTQIP